jgi:hypothetical protein
MKLPQLSLRELFWIVLVCALAVGWWVERRGLIERAKAADQRYEVARESVQQTRNYYDLQLSKATDK